MDTEDDRLDDRIASVSHAWRAAGNHPRYDEDADLLPHERKLDAADAEREMRHLMHGLPDDARTRITCAMHATQGRHASSRQIADTYSAGSERKAIHAMLKGPSRSAAAYAAGTALMARERSYER